MATYKPFGTNQSIQRAALSTSIGSAANTTVDALFAQIDSVMANKAGAQTLTNKTINGANNTLNVRLNTSDVSSILPAAKGGTGLSSSGTLGNVLTSNGTTWISSPAPSGTSPIGGLDSAFLTETQYQAQQGAGWVLCDGRTVSGSLYEAILGGSSVHMSANATGTVTGVSLTFSTAIRNTTGNFTSGSVVIQNIPSIVGVAVGQLINSSSQPSLSTVAFIGVNMTNNATGFSASETVIFSTPILSTTGTLVLGNSSISNLASTTGIVSGQLINVNGGGFAPGTTVTSPIQYTFTVTSANATAGATYTNNAHTFTVVNTIAAGTTLVCTGTGAPTATGTLTKASGTGDATITFSAENAGVTVSSPALISGSTLAANFSTIVVTTTSEVDPASNILSNLGTTTGILTSQLVTGTFIPYGTTVSSFVVDSSANSSATTTGTSVTFSNNPIVVTGNTTSGSNIVSALSSTVGLATTQVVSSTVTPAIYTVTSLTVAAIPDARGLMLRGANNGGSAAGTRTGSLADPANPSITATQLDTLASHTHTASTGGESAAHNHVFGTITFSNNSSIPPGPNTNEIMSTNQAGGTNTVQTTGNNSNDHTHAVTVNATGSTETRVKAIVVNHFIRIN